MGHSIVSSQSGKSSTAAALDSDRLSPRETINFFSDIQSAMNSLRLLFAIL